MTYLIIAALLCIAFVCLVCIAFRMFRHATKLPSYPYRVVTDGRGGYHVQCKHLFWWTVGDGDDPNVGKAMPRLPLTRARGRLSGGRTRHE